MTIHTAPESFARVERQFNRRSLLIGTGAALAGLVTAVPQLIRLSEHKPLVFGIAGALLVISGGSLWVSRRAPCPTDPALARSCQRLRRISAVIYTIALISFVVGVAFAFVLPIFSV